MGKVSTLLAKKRQSAVTIQKGTAVFHALEEMANKNIGSLVILDGDKYLGILTERDYSRKVFLQGKNSHETLVEEIMSTSLPSVIPSDTIEHCMELMSDKNVRYLPVFDGDKLAGVVSISDVVSETIHQQKETISHLKDYIHGQS